jgi:hypothetical protein
MDGWTFSSFLLKCLFSFFLEVFSRVSLCVCDDDFIWGRVMVAAWFKRSTDNNNNETLNAHTQMRERERERATQGHRWIWLVVSRSLRSFGPPESLSPSHTYTHTQTRRVNRKELGPRYRRRDITHGLIHHGPMKRMEAIHLHLLFNWERERAEDFLPFFSQLIAIVRCV